MAKFDLKIGETVWPLDISKEYSPRFERFQFERVYAEKYLNIGKSHKFKLNRKCLVNSYET